MQVQYVEERWSKTRKVEKIKSGTSKAKDESIDELRQEVDNGLNAKPSAASHGVQNGIPPPPPTPNQDKETVTHLRKAHSAWDRAQRDIVALSNKAAQHENTRGCKFQVDLVRIAKEGGQTDTKIVQLEQLFLEGKQYTEEDTMRAAELCNTIKELMTEGSRKMNALRPWFKMA